MTQFNPGRPGEGRELWRTDGKGASNCEVGPTAREGAVLMDTKTKGQEHGIRRTERNLVWLWQSEAKYVRTKELNKEKGLAIEEGSSDLPCRRVTGGSGEGSKTGCKAPRWDGAVTQVVSDANGHERRDSGCQALSHRRPPETSSKTLETGYWWEQQSHY